MMRTANPALNAGTFVDAIREATTGARTMTIQGTVAKTGVLLLCCIAAASFTWSRFASAIDAHMDMGQAFGLVAPWVIGGAIGGLVVAIVTAFWKKGAPITAPLYAGLEGLFLGGISAMMNAAYPGIAFQAVALTFGVLGALLLAYTTRLIKPTENFKLGVAAATGGIFLLYLVSFVMGFFGMNIPFIHQSGAIGIGFSLFVVVIAALNLVLDFDFIEQGAQSGAPKHMEWYAGFGLMVTLVWLYIEVLRLLSKLRRE
jgi:uncharacterized YccA/Bax inhibitor family protein